MTVGVGRVDCGFAIWNEPDGVVDRLMFVDTSASCRWKEIGFARRSV